MPPPEKPDQTVDHVPDQQQKQRPIQVKPKPETSDCSNAESALNDPQATGAYQAGSAATATGADDGSTATQQANGRTLRRFGDYDLEREIARGGMGVVYKARQVSLNRPVALKMILSAQLASEADVQRFRAEAEAAANLDHPGIVPIYEVGEIDGQHFFSMGLVEGGSLGDKVKLGSMPPREAVQIVQQVAEAVHYAHMRNIVHRDLKPANILLDADGQPKVTDFGLAKNVEGASGLTVSGQILGTPSYMPPEQAAGRMHEIGPLADVYSLGAILYNLLTGKPPFQGSGVLDTLKQVQERDPVSPRQLNHKIDLDLATICLKCLEKDPGRRYRSAAELADELGRYLNSEPITARPISWLERLWRWCRRKPLPAGLAISVALLVATVALVASVGLVQTRMALKTAEDQRKEANRQRNRAQDEAARHRRLRYVSDMQLAAHIWDGEKGTARQLRELLRAHIPKKNQTDQREFTWRLQWNLLHGSSSLLAGHTGGVLLAFVGDGRLVTLDERAVIRHWDTAGGRLLFSKPLRQIQKLAKVALSADGSLAVLADSQGGVYLYDAATGLEKRAIKRRVKVRDLTLSRDGRLLAIVTADKRVIVWAVDRESPSHVIQLKTLNDYLFSRIRAGLRIAPDNNTLFLGNHPKNARLATFRIEDANRQVFPPGHESTVHSAAYSADGKLLATGDANGQVFLWDTNPPKRMTCHTGFVTALAFDRNGQRLATGDSNGVVRIWDVGRRSRLRNLMGHVEAIVDLAFSKDGQWLATASTNGAVRLWPLTGSPAEPVLTDNDDSVLDLAFSPNGKWLATAGGDGKARLRDAATGRLIQTLVGHAAIGVGKSKINRVTSVVFSPDSQTLATGGLDSRIVLYDAATRRQLQALTGKPTRLQSMEDMARQAVGSLAFSPDGGRIAAGFGLPTVDISSHAQVAKVWNLANMEEVCTLRLRNSVPSLAFSPDGSLATASHDQSVKLWDAGDGRIIRTWQRLDRPDKNRVYSVAVSPDGLTVAAGRCDGTIVMWDVRTGRKLRELKGHRSKTVDLAFSPDGKTLASASWDRSVKLWYVPAGRELRTLNGHTGWVQAVAFSSDGNTLASAGLDGTLRLWKAASPRRIAAAHAEDVNAK